MTTIHMSLHPSDPSSGRRLSDPLRVGVPAKAGRFAVALLSMLLLVALAAFVRVFVYLYFHGDSQPVRALLEQIGP